MLIRFATPDDLPAILEISNWAALHTPANFAIEPESLADWSRSFEQTHRQFPWFVAIEDNLVVGFAKASPHRGRCAYGWTAEVSVYMHQEHHRRGIGTLLYRRLIPLLAHQGYATLLAGITLPNPASERLHEAFGFHSVGIFHRVGWKFSRWHDVGYWEAFLQPLDDSPRAIVSVADATRNEVRPAP